MEKFIKDGQVAVVYSPGYGAGWSTWNQEYGDELVFDSGIVDLVLAKKSQELEAYLTLKYPDAYTGGIETLDIRWVPAGTRFRINEYDGSESVVLEDEEDWLIA